MKTMKALKALVLAASFLAFPAFAGHPVNVNQADAAELSAALDGVGMSKAAAIIQYRAQNGPFKHADEMVNVKGIGCGRWKRTANIFSLVENLTSNQRAVPNPEVGALSEPQGCGPENHKEVKARDQSNGPGPFYSVPHHQYWHTHHQASILIARCKATMKSSTSSRVL
jgi:competence protein ComEA